MVPQRLSWGKAWQRERKILNYYASTHTHFTRSTEEKLGQQRKEIKKISYPFVVSARYYGHRGTPLPSGGHGGQVKVRSFEALYLRFGGFHLPDPSPPFK